MLSSSPSEPLLRISQVTKKFGLIVALWKVDLDVRAGEFVAVFGPNGAGKSTLLRVAATLTRPDQGTVTLRGQEQARHQFGYVSHQSLLYNDLTGLENLLFYARLYGLDDASGRSQEMLGKMGLLDAADQLVRGYSRGMKQRLTLARALLHQPGLLLLDEPYTGLDQHGSRLLTEVLARLREEGRTVLLITHNLSEGLELCTRFLIQRRGEIVHQAERAEIQRSGLEKLYFDLVES